MKSGNLPGSILLIKPSSLGDIVHTLPVADALKKNWPSAQLSWVVNEEWQEILADNAAVDRIIPFPRKRFRGISGLWKGLRWIGGLRQLRPDLGIDLQGLLRSACMAKGAGCKKIVGLADAREGASFFYHSAAKPEKNMHSVDRYLSILSLLNLPLPDCPQFTLPEGQCPQTFQFTKPYLLLHPFSRGHGKSLDKEVVVAFCKQWTRTPIVLAGRIPEKNAAEMTHAFPAHVVNLLNQTSLSELLWLIRHAGCVISVDSGPMHLAAALTKNLLSIHTWSDPRLVGPYFDACSVWKNGLIRSMSDFRKSPDLSNKLFTINDIGSAINWIPSHFSDLQ